MCCHTSISEYDICEILNVKICHVEFLIYVDTLVHVLFVWFEIENSFLYIQTCNVLSALGHFLSMHFIKIRRTKANVKRRCHIFFFIKLVQEPWFWLLLVWDPLYKFKRKKINTQTILFWRWRKTWTKNRNFRRKLSKTNKHLII
jgi:hypothetical protein